MNEMMSFFGTSVQTHKKALHPVYGLYKFETHLKAAKKIVYYFRIIGFAALFSNVILFVSSETWLCGSLVA